MMRRRFNAGMSLGACGLALAIGCSGPGDSKVTEPSASAAASAIETLALSQEPGTILPTEVGPDGRAAGYTAGGAGVSPTGAATYSVPLWSPAGRAGVQPSFSLTYSSQAGEGIAGSGWSLSGLSRITRCGWSLAQDNYNTTVRFDSNVNSGDHYCLDGQRLVAIGGAYGAEGTEYRVESGGFEKVVALNVTTDGPRTFKVFGKDGTVRTYGEAPGHQHALFEGQLQGPYNGSGGRHGIYAWGLQRVEDTSGNYLVVHYALTGDPTAGYEWLASDVQYTGSTRGLSPTRRVELEYEPVPQPSVAWIAGFKLSTSQRLKRVKAFGPDLTGASALLKRYELTYAAPAAGQDVTLLESVEECDGAGACFGPLFFRYDTPQNPPAQPQTIDLLITSSSIKPSYAPHYYVGDLNGDGLDDILYRKTDIFTDESQNAIAYFYRLSQGSQLGPERPAIGLPEGQLQKFGDSTTGNYYRWLFAGEGHHLVDVDGDGRADFVGTWYDYHQASDGTWQQWAGNEMLRNAPGATPDDVSFGSFYAEPVSWPRPMAGWRFVDLDGDGKLEYAGHDEQRGQLRFRRYENGSYPYGYSLFPWSRADALQAVTPARDNRAALGSGNFFVGVFDLGAARTGYDGPLAASEDSLSADVNGDGLEDMVIMGPGYLDVSINTGAGYEARRRVTTDRVSFPILACWFAGPTQVLGDTDGNGRDEIRCGSHVSELDRSGALVNKPLSLGWDDQMMGDFNGDGIVDRVQETRHNIHQYLTVTMSSGLRQPVLVRAEKGAVYDAFSYGHTGDRQVYTPGSANIPAPLLSRQRGTWVVKSRARKQVFSGPIPVPPITVASFSYTYGNSLADTRGRGWLGFGTRTTHDDLTGATTTITSQLDRKVGSQYVTAGLPEQETTEVTVDGVLYRSYRQHAYGFEASIWGVVSPAWHTVHETQCRAPAGGSEVCDRQWSTATFLDGYGNPTQSWEKVRWERSGNHYDNSATTTVTSTYEPPDTTRWLVSRRKRTTTTFERAVGAVEMVIESSTNTTDFITNPQTGQINGVIREPESTDPKIKLLTYIGYTPHGLPAWVQSQDTGSLVRFATVEYDPVEAMFPVKVEGGGQRTLSQYHPGLGLRMRSQNTQGVAETYSYDGFGRVRKVDAPHEGDETLSYQASSNGGMTVARARVSGGELRTEIDALGRTWRQRTLDASGAPVFVDTVYEGALGLSVRTSLPYAQGETPKYSRREGDILGRVRKITRADGAFSTYDYPDFFHTVMTDEMARRHHTTVDGRGLTLETTDEEPVTGRLSSISFHHDVRGHLLGVTRTRSSGDGSDPEAAVTSFAYDLLGRRTLVADPDRGLTSTTYNAFGEIATVTNDAGVTSYTSRDAHGRPVLVETPEGPVGYVWDLSSLGQMASSTSADGVITTYLYDAWGRPSTTRWTVGQETFDSTITYDAHGRPETVTYPAAGGERLTVRRQYDGAGQLEQLSNVADGVPYWRALQRNAAGQIRQEQLGSGVTTSYAYDPLGRLRFVHAQTASEQTVQKLAFDYAANSSLTERHDLLTGTSEDFSYDDLDRLTGWKVTQGGKVSEEAYDYDDLGNLTGRRILSGPGFTSQYGYAASWIGPHRLATHTKPFLGSVRTPSYDAVGRQTADGLGRTIEFTSFDLPKRVLQGGNEVARYSYDASGARVLKHLSNGDETLTLAGGLYERRTSQGAHTHVFSVHAGGHPVAQIHWQEGAGGAVAQRRVYFQHTDAAGTQTAITDEAGAEIERLKLDPWGARRNPLDVGEPYQGPMPVTERGFQGHALDAESSLVHMRGRMYDAAMGAFLTVDPHVSNVFDSRAHNPYRFGLNNPLKYSDPSGYDPEIIGYYPGPGYGSPGGGLPSGGSLITISPGKACRRNDVCHIDEHNNLVPGPPPPPTKPPTTTTPQPKNPPKVETDQPGSGGGSGTRQFSRAEGHAAPTAPFSPVDNSLYINGDYGWEQYSRAVDEAMRPTNAWWERGVFAGLAVLSAVPAGLVHYVAMPIANVPHTVLNSGIVLGERSASATINLENGDGWGAAIDIAHTVQSGSEGFVAAGSVLAPVGAAVEARLGATSACAGGACRLGSCFVAGTLVLTPDGLRPIEIMTAGEIVVSRDAEAVAGSWQSPAARVDEEPRRDDADRPFDGEARLPSLDEVVWVLAAHGQPSSRLFLRDVAAAARLAFQGRVYEARRLDGRLTLRATGETLRRVRQTMRRGAERLVELTVRTPQGEHRHVGTPQHPFYVPARRAFVSMGQLEPGMGLLSEGGQLVEVVAVEGRAASSEVFNFEVEGTHTYFVCDDAPDRCELVHNDCPTPGVPMEYTPNRPPGKGIPRQWTPSGRQITESPGATRALDRLSPEVRRGVDEGLSKIAFDKAGLNQHALRGDRAGQWAMDIPGTGSGRGAGRLIYSYEKDGGITLIEVLLQHNY